MRCIRGPFLFFFVLGSLIFAAETLEAYDATDYAPCYSSYSEQKFTPIVSYFNQKVAFSSEASLSQQFPENEGDFSGHGSFAPAVTSVDGWDVGSTEAFPEYLCEPVPDFLVDQQIVQSPRMSTGARFCDKALDFGGRLRTDYWNYYSWNTAWRLCLAVGLAAPFANTGMDMNFHNWYQKNLACTTVTETSQVCEKLGRGYYLIPGFACAALIACAIPDDWGLEGQPFCQWSKNVARSYLVGAPAMLAMQYILGGSRPFEAPHGPAWHPFSDNNSVSGHAFMGAVPFIIAAKSTDSFLLKTTFYLLSTFAAWSRLNDGAHSLSQVCLGWYMAYLACDIVSATNENRDVRSVTILPFMSGNTVGLGACWRF